MKILGSCEGDKKKKKDKKKKENIFPPLIDLTEETFSPPTSNSDKNSLYFPRNSFEIRKHVLKEAKRLKGWESASF